MGASIHIKTALKAKGITSKSYSDSNGIPYQTFRNKLCRDCLNYNAVEKIADDLGCDVVFLDRETSELY